MSVMKQVIFFSLSAILLMSSCKKDDQSISAANILGSWTSTEKHITGCTDGTSNGTFSFDCPSNDCRTFVFVVDTAVVNDEKIVTQYYSTSTFNNGVAVNESGTFSLGSGIMTLCTEIEDEEVCRNVNINLNGDILLVFNTNDDTGCEEQTTYERATN